MKGGCRLFLMAGWGMTPHVWDPLLLSLDSRFETTTGNWNEYISISRDHSIFHDICVGWSLGSMLLLEAILNGSIKTDHLILVAATSCFTGNNHFPGKHPRVLQRMKTKLKCSREDILRDFIENSLDPVEDPELVNHLLELSAGHTDGELALGLDYLLNTELTGRLSEISVKTTVIHGSDDGIVPHEAGRFLQSGLSDSHYVEIKGGGHAIPLTHYQLIRDLLHDHEHKQQPDH